MSIDPATVQRFVEETAAEEIMVRFRRLADHEIRTKQGGELVTEADVASEARLTRLLRDYLPGSLVVGEEATAERPEALDLLQGADPVWLIDPVDGTANFAAGRPTFAVMVALVEKGKILASWIHEPSLARTAVAETGGGAWIGDGRLQVAAAVPLSDMCGTLHAGSFGGRELRRRVEAARERLGAIPSLRCAGAEYVRLAAGSLHYGLIPERLAEDDEAGDFHYTLFTKMMPWDHAPGVLLFTEAGGLARTFDRQVYDPARRDTPGLIMAPDEASWEALHEVLLG
jgi:fructose-1,6-bisphosphatase/inositol monophosphatase family enzyme